MIVTGAAQGIGAELAGGIVRAGGRVIIADVDSGDATALRLNQGSASTDRVALAVHCDVTEEASVQAMVAAGLAEFGSVHGLVNNAALFGRLSAKNLFEIPVAEWDQVMAVNVRGPWLMARHTIREIAEAGGGAVVNIASNRVLRGFPNLLHYDASKGAVTAMTKSMAREAGPLDVRVNCIAPGLTMSQSVLQKEGIEDRAPMIAAGRALARNQLPEDLVGAVNFLLSDASAFVTGQTLVVDGGGVMH